MNFPDDLPEIMEYLTRSGTAIYTLPRTPVETISSSGKTNACYVCPEIPYGAIGWRRVWEKEWHVMEDIPAEWMPFLQRERGTQMDPRSKHHEKESQTAENFGEGIHVSGNRAGKTPRMESSPFSDSPRPES